MISLFAHRASDANRWCVSLALFRAFPWESVVVALSAVAAAADVSPKTEQWRREVAREILRAQSIVDMKRPTEPKPGHLPAKA